MRYRHILFTPDPYTSERFVVGAVWRDGDVNRVIMATDPPCEHCIGSKAAAQLRLVTSGLGAAMPNATTLLSEYTPERLKSLLVTTMFCGFNLGMACGGFLVARAERLERTIALAMMFAAALLLLTATGWLPGGLAATVAALAGFGTGLAGPSRDMLIKRAAPPGATGRVYGTVYSGLDVGFALAAPVFGWMMDHGHPAGVFAGAAMVLMLGVLAATAVGGHTRTLAAHQA